MGGNFGLRNCSGRLLFKIMEHDVWGTGSKIQEIRTFWGGIRKSENPPEWDPWITKSLQCSLGLNCVTLTLVFPAVYPHWTLGLLLAERDFLRLFTVQIWLEWQYHIICWKASGVGVVNLFPWEVPRVLNLFPRELIESTPQDFPQANPLLHLRIDLSLIHIWRCRRRG